MTYGDSNNPVKNKSITLTDADGGTRSATTNNSGVATFNNIPTGAVTFASITYTHTSSQWPYNTSTYRGTPAGVTLNADGDTAQASVNLSFFLAGSADHIDLRMQNASITVNTKIVEAGNPSNILSSSTTTTTASVIGVTSAVITWNDGTAPRTITGFAPRPGYSDYEYTKGFDWNKKIDKIQNIESVVFTITLLDANNITHNTTVSYDQAGVQLAAKNCDGSNGGTTLSGLDFDVATVTNLFIEKTISTNKIIKVTKNWDDKGLQLVDPHPSVDITVTQTCGENTLSDTKTLASGSTELMFGFLELDDMTYTYTVSETPVSGYIVSGGAVTPVNPEGGFNYQYEATLTNTYDISDETISFVGTKVWSDSEEIEHNNADLILTLYADGIAVQATPAWVGNMFYFHELPMYKETNDGLVDIVYTVIETPPQNYRASYSGEGFCENEGTITNTYFKSDEPQPIPPQPPVTMDTADLTITKTVSGDVDEAPDSSFDFTVTFTPGAPDYWNLSGINAPAGASGSDGTYTFSLKADQSITFSTIPVGTTYTVTETTELADGWSAGTATDASGSIGANGAIATIDNVYTAPEQGVAGDVTKEPPSDDGSASEDGQQVAGDVDTLPQTGGISPSTLLGIFGLALITIGGAAFTILRRKNDGKSKSKSK